MTQLRSEFLAGMSQAAATVSVVTTDGPNGRAGVTVSAMTSVSADGPAPTMLACVNASSRSAVPILENRCFVINVLAQDQQAVADLFAGRIQAPGGDKFNGVQHTPMSSGAPRIEGALVSFDCTVFRADLVETHWVLIGAVQEIHAAPEGKPLMYGMRSYLKAEKA